MKKKIKMLKPLPEGIINPFSENFLETWMLWKQYKWEEFKFKYKGVLSEQAALINLNDLSAGNEQSATEIIKQSMANGWKGFFSLKNNINGNSKAAQREDISREFGTRDYSGRRY
jgi:hypothetical protein